MKEKLCKVTPLRSNRSVKYYDFTVEMKMQIIAEYLSRESGKEAYLKSINLSRNTFNTWRKKYNNNLPLFDKRGRPRLLTDPDLADILKFSTGKITSGKAANYSEIEQLAIDKVNNNLMIRKNPLKRVAIHKKTLKYIMTKNNYFKVKRAQEKTTARMKAEVDPRNAISTICMFKYLLQYVTNMALMINYDATQFCVKSEADTDHYVVVPAIKDEDIDIIPSTDNYNASELAYGIKHFCIISALGICCQHFVFLLADRNLNENEMTFYKINGMSNSSAADSFGYLCFTKTRAGNNKFFDFLTMEILVPYVKFLQKTYKTDNDNAFITCDGEATQIYPYLTTSAKEIMDMNNILVGKLAASTTAVTQACDAHHIFSASKQICSTISASEVDANTFLIGALTEAFNEQESKHGKFKAGEKSRLVHGVAKCTMALNKSLRATTIKHSFEKIGITSNGMSYTAVLGQFKIKIDLKEYSVFQKQIVDGVKCFEENGTITDEELNKFDLVKKYLSMKFIADEARDLRAIHNQRCVVLTHSETIKRFDAKLKLKEEAALKIAANKLLKEEKKRLAAIDLIAKQNRAAANANTGVVTKKKKITPPVVIADPAPPVVIAKPVTSPKDCYCTCNISKSSQLNFIVPMVQCTNGEICEGNEWFHIDCFKANEIPPTWDDWYCGTCTK